jgi:hypothetical protein
MFWSKTPRFQGVSVDYKAVGIEYVCVHYATRREDNPHQFSGPLQVHRVKSVGIIIEAIQAI